MSPDDAPKPRGRPRAFDLDTALDAAGETFLARGYAGASVADLAGAMGVNKPSLYAAFGGKEELFFAAAARRAEQVGAVLGAAFMGETTLSASIAAMLRRAVTLYTPKEASPGCVVLSAMLPAVAEIPQAAAWSAAFFRARDNDLAYAVARKLGRRGRPNAIDRAVGMLAFAAIRDVALRSRAGQPRAEIEAAVTSFASAIDALAASAER